MKGDAEAVAGFYASSLFWVQLRQTEAELA
jgi:hypothetical protein